MSRILHLPKSVDKAWQELSEDIGGTYLPYSFVDNRMGGIDKSHHGWTIRMVLRYGRYFNDGPVSRVPQIRVRAAYVGLTDYDFKIYQRNIWNSIAKLIGMRTIKTDWPDIDRKLIVKSSDCGVMLQLLESPQIRNSLLSQTDHFSFRVRHKLGQQFIPSNTNILEYHTFGTIKRIGNLSSLTQLFDLFSDTLDQLCKIGIADEQSPRYFTW